MSVNTSKENVDLPALETKCDECNGDGQSRTSDEECFFCKGAGFIPTDFGKQLLALIQHGLRLDETRPPSWRMLL
jgi:RecJ-like exonuclease